MDDFSHIFLNALWLLLTFDDDLWSIVALTLKVSLLALFFASIVGFLCAGLLNQYHFFGKKFLLIIIHSFMGLPPVVVGLFIYLLLSHQGPLGTLNLLYTSKAMIMAQFCLIVPIITGLSYQVLQDYYQKYEEHILSLRLTRWQVLGILLYEIRLYLLSISITGFGRAIAEVGAVMIVGGNIHNYTRVLTTAISLETSKGNLSMAVSLGILLLCLALTVNLLAYYIQTKLKK